ncbi:MAG: GlxA family transcriptional regulator [Phycicoccus sp.]
MTIGVLVVDDMFDSGLAVTLDVLATASALAPSAGGPDAPEVVLLGPGRRARTARGLTVETTPFAEFSTRLGVVVCPAMNHRTFRDLIAVVRGHPTLPWLVRQHDAGARLAAACTGTMFLAEAGLLDGRAATTSWWHAPQFRQRYPAVHLDESRTLVDDRSIVTAGAALAHADLALALVAARSPALADAVARNLLIGARSTQAAFSIPAQLAADDPLVVAFEQHVRARLDQPGLIAESCAAFGVSERTLQRATTARLGMTPLAFIQELRLERAVHLLRTTTMSTGAVARAVGYRDTGAFRAMVRRRRGCTPRQLIGTGPATTSG